jgi:ribosomal protein S9
MEEILTKEDVQSFLELFHTKMKVFGLLFRDDRGKNQRALEELEIVPSYRRVIIENLTVEDYAEGPVVDTLNNLGEMWVFGKDIKGREVYIKIMISGLSGQTICISFHIAESPMKYPFK